MLRVKYGTAVILYSSVFAPSSRSAKVNPTIAAGDIQISKDGGAYANLATLPDLTPATLDQVRMQLSATEMQCKTATIRWKDQTTTAEWDEQRIQIVTYGHPSAFDTSGFDCIRTSTAQAGAAGSITLDASASATNDLYIGCGIQIISGTGVGQARTIILYVGSSKIAYVDRVWATNPDNTSVFAILPGKLTADVINTGLAQAGAGTTITLATTAVATNDYYDGAVVQIISGTGIRQSRVIRQYTGASRIAVVADSWATTPDNTSVYMVRGLGDVEVGYINDGLISDSTFAVDCYPKGLRKATAQAGSAGSITLDASASAVNDFYVGCSIKITSGTGAGQSRTIILYIGSSKIAYVDRVWATNPANDSIFLINSGKLTADVVNSGLAQAGASTTITLASNAVATNNYYNTSFVTIISGTGLGQSREIYSYVGSTKVATVKAAWAVNPDNTSVYIVRGFGNVDANLELILGTQLTETTGGLITAAFKKLFDIAAPASTLNDLATLAKLLKYIQLLARKDAAIKTDNATEFTAINANGGSGGGTFDNLTDSTEAIRDRGDEAWITGTVLNAQGVRDALKLAPTAGDPAAGSIDKELDDIGAKTTNLPSDPADESLIIAATDAVMTAVGEVNDVVKSGGTGDCAAIYSQTNKLAFDGYNVYANVDMIKNSEAAASGLAESAKTIYIGSVDDVGFAPTSTQFESSDFDEADTDFWKDCWVVFKTGTLAGQRKPITGCSLHSGKVRFTTEEFTGAPAASDTFNVL